MKILFFLSKSYLPQLSGGTESSTNDLCINLLKKDIKPLVFCGIRQWDSIWLMNRIKSKIYKKPFVEDYIMGYPVFRGWEVERELSSCIADYSPDIVVFKNGVSPETIDLVKKFNIPIIIYIRDLSVSLPSHYPIFEGISYVANSNFIAKRIFDVFGFMPSVLPPLVEKKRINVLEKVLPSKVTFIGLNCEKGVDLAFDIARDLPDIPFQFYESWSLSKSEFDKYKKLGRSLGNVDVKKRVNDVRKIYENTKILLFPSQVEEAWGRVASEAHICGIPVVGSNIGGIPESVGPGGVLVDPKAASNVWAKEIDNLWHDDNAYEVLSSEALSFSKRKDFQPSIIINKFLSICNSMLKSS